VRVGVLSDTHGLLRNGVYAAFEGVEHIVHAGDVGDPGILVELAALAPVTAVVGNVDGWDLVERCPEEARLELAGARLAVVHGHRWGAGPRPDELLAAYPDADVIIFGHTHEPLVERRGRALLLNPGAAGPARPGRPPTVAVLTLEPGRAPAARLVRLRG
jgi:putative phosphoesterase